VGDPVALAVGEAVVVEEAVGVGADVGDGVAVGVGSGDGVGDAGRLIDTVPPETSGSTPCGASARKVTDRVPAGSVVVARYVPSAALPLKRLSEIGAAIPETVARTQLGASPWPLR
jgi:tetrahydrodipicolinate N-succinyltransferase